MIVDHVIDASVWTQPVNINKVRVLLNYEMGNPAFGRTLNHIGVSSLRAYGTTFGTLNGLNVVIVRRGTVENLQRGDARALASHEAFHAAVQYHSLRPRFDSVTTPTLPNDFYVDVVQQLSRKLFAALQGGNDHRACRAIATIMTSDKRVRNYFLERAYTEWPAEWYMRSATMSSQSFDAYLALRTAWGGGTPNMLYVAGVLALDKVDREMGRNAWEAAYMRGAHPFNLLSEACGCGTPVGSSFQVDRSLKHIFD